MGEKKTARDRSLTAAGRLEVDSSRNPHRTGWRDLHAALIDRVFPRHANGVDAAVIVSLRAEDLIDLSRVEVDRGRRSGRRSSERRLALGECGADGGSHLDRIAMSANVHVIRRWIAA